MEKISFVSLRGAINLKENSKNEIITKACKLFGEMIKKNNIVEQDILNVFISFTDDITEYSPTTAIRKHFKFNNTAFFSTQEPKIKNSLKLCIRILITLQLNSYHKNLVKFIYLEDAKNLRKEVYNVAIDGLSGSGKSTSAKILSEKLNIKYLDTGAMYRAIAYLFEKNKDKPLEDILDEIKFEFFIDNNIQKIKVNDIDVSEIIRIHKYSMMASEISKENVVRQKLTQIQREFAANESCVLDGRDIGAFVLPNAKFKFFLIADLEIRAERRYLELRKKGQNITQEEVKKELEIRDYNDTHRKISPLTKAKDAIEIDTTNATAEGVVKKMINIIKKEL